MVMGIFAAVLVAVVVIFVFSKLTGLFLAKSGQDKETEVVTSETATEGINVSLADNQTYMPNVLGLPKDMAEAKLKEYNLVMSIETEDYSDNYKADPGHAPPGCGRRRSSGKMEYSWRDHQ